MTTPCPIPDCPRDVQTHGMCRTHYARLQRSGTTDAPVPRNHGQCAVPDCERSARSRGWCGMHYRRWQVTGDPTKVHKIKSPERAPCQVDGCSGTSVGHGYCDKHYRNLRRNGTPHRLPLAETYEAVHGRMRRRNGRAADHLCVQCFDQAAEWAYTQDDPDVRVERQSKSGGITVHFSTDIDRYLPMCIPCHRAMDLAPDTP